MVEITEYIKNVEEERLELLSPSKLGEQIEVVIRGEGRLVNTRFGQRLFIEVQVKGKDEKYNLVVNKTNAKVISDAYGSDTKAWVGKVIRLTATQLMVGGKTRLSWVASPVREEKRKEG